jgi:hypothetical protein
MKRSKKKWRKYTFGDCCGRPRFKTVSKATRQYKCRLCGRIREKYRSPEQPTSGEIA